MKKKKFLSLLLIFAAIFLVIVISGLSGYFFSAPLESADVSETEAQPASESLNVTTTVPTTTTTAVTTAAPTTAATAAADRITITITGDMINVRSGADSNSPKIGSASKGEVFDYLSQATDEHGTLWYEIQFTGSTTGWIAGKYGKKSATDSPKSPKATELPSSPQSNVNRIAKKYNAVGLQVAVIDNGKVTGTYNYGYATKDTKKMATDIKIRIASISKVAVAVNAMKMQEQGIVDINTQIGEYWGAKLPKSVTLKNLLTHTSTLKRLGYIATKADTLKQLKRGASYGNKTVGASDSWAYNNYAIGVAGSTLELASKQSLDSFAKTNVFTPLDMDASFWPGALSKTNKLATLYAASGNVSRSVSSSKRMTGSSKPGSNINAFAGGLTCSAEDLAKMVAMLANNGEYNGVRVLTPASVAALEEKFFAKTENGGSFIQCLTLRYKDNLYGESELYYHTGHAFGVLALMSYNPATGDGVVVVSTGASIRRDSQGVYAVCSEITEYMYKNVI
ncbi:MAG: serine hydrolase [Oscillospiraceae bacterium]|nr:serine hydrolase [Oscillospiraceae bacterium]